MKSVKTKNEAYTNATPAEKIKTVKQVENLVNKADKDLKTLDFEINMLPQEDRPEYKETMKKIR